LVISEKSSPVKRNTAMNEEKKISTDIKAFNMLLRKAKNKRTINEGINSAAR